MTWNPLHDNLIGSSLLANGTDVVAVWALLVASADRYGVSEVTASAMASLMHCERARIDSALRILSSPDPDSKSKREEGRRILPHENGGWILVNHDLYRERATAQAAAIRKARSRERQERIRAYANHEVPSENPDRVAPANPLVAGRRDKLERELQTLVAREAKLTDRDPIEVMSEVTHYKGASMTKLNPATMGDDRLANSVLDARARVKELEARKAKLAR